ncbi:MAG: tRNA pseudouridine(38-40) synthase TruA [Acidobacteria bacterium]|nr:tRNA pseudouridine(38-40) synthase TruA [Acidobacteriota bacterium]
MREKSNYKITIQYDGTNYHGWQIQPRGLTIQGELQRALSLLDHRAVTLHGAGRTDAGVHAEGQVANFFLEREITPTKLREAINGNLPRDIRVMDVELVADDFHARFSAQAKTYGYKIFSGEVIPPFDYRYALFHRDKLDVEAMREAASLLMGQHDFSAFTVADSEVKDHVRTLTRLEISVAEEKSGKRILITATADGFLRYMVRTMAGTLLDVGRGFRKVEEVGEALASGDRRNAGQTAKAHGLTLLRVDY